MLRSAPERLLVKNLKLFVIIIVFILFPHNAIEAAELTLTVRIDRLATSQSTGGLVCATTPVSNTGTESRVQVAFPGGFTLNQTASNWTVGTSNIPDSATAWPGIGTALSVSGQTVTFPSSDLGTNTQYCFTFSSTSTLITPSTTGSYEGTVRTRNSSNSTLDSKDFGIAIVNNDQIVVTATAPANPTDFEALLYMIDPSNSFYHPENTVLTYQLTYGSHLNHATQMTVEAEWGLGTIQGNPTATEDILDYVVGSGTYGYNGAPPIIDTLNRKISWTIPNFPANTTGQTVRFKLITNSSPTTKLPINFSVAGRVLGPGTQTPDFTVDSIYQKAAFITPTPTPTCAPGRCPTSTPAPTTAPTPTKPPLPRTQLLDIDIRTITATTAAIYVATSENAKVRIDVGTDYNRLRSLGFSNTYTRQHLITLTRLQPNTQYYMRVIATDPDNTTTTSDLYSFRTAQISIPPEVITRSLLVISNDVILSDARTSGYGQVIIPIQTPFTFKFSVQNFEHIEAVEAIVRNSNVLGITTSNAPSLSSQKVVTSEIGPGQFIGKLLSTTTPGSYNLFIKIKDFNGNLTEQKVADLYIVEPLRIIEIGNGKGIENAKITFYYFNPRLRTYTLITSNVTPILNPNTSNGYGVVSTVLPMGKYKAEIEALGYVAKEIEFTLNVPDRTLYPTIELVRAPFSPATYVQYFAGTTSDFVQTCRDFTHQLRESFRFFDLVAFFLVTFFVALLTIATSKKLSIPLWLLPYFAWYSLVRFFGGEKHTFIIHGRVITLGAGEAVKGAIVYVGNPSGTITTHVSTNGLGEFFVRFKDSSNVRITISKKGFKSLTTVIKKGQLNERITLVTTQIGKPKSLSFKNLLWYFEYILSSLFEALLLGVLVFEILFALEFGWIVALPFLIISLLNIVLWAVNIRPAKI